MPPKAHRPGLTRNHSHTRTSSGSSSKVALNLHFTQKEPPQPKGDKPKRHPITSARSGTALQKSNSASRISSRDNIAALTQVTSKAPPARRGSDKAQQPPPVNGTKHRAGFTLATSTVGSDDEDDEEWISSESGAATPDKHHDEQTSSGSDDAPVKTPQDTRQRPLPLTVLDGKGNVVSPAQAVTTPHADKTPTPTPLLGHFTQQQQPQQPQQQQQQSQRRPDKSALARPPVPAPRPAATPTHTDSPAPPSASSTTFPTRPPAPNRFQAPGKTTAPGPRTPSPPPQTQSRTQPPTPTSPRPHAHRAKRMSATRPPSVASEHGPPLRPHPLIRGNSYGVGHLAPLTVSSTAAQAQLSASPPSPAYNVRSPASSIAAPDASRFARRLSTSSARSTATLPAPSSSTTFIGSAGNKDRTRTLSSMSSSSSAALTSLAHIPINAAPRRDAPAPFPRFPPIPTGAAAAAAGVHALLPQPYVQPHATVLVWRAPIRESYERVLRAKTKKRAG